MAAALAFRTLFGLLPVLVVATVLVKALGMQQHYLGPLDKLFEFWGLDQVKIVPPAEIGLTASVTLSVWLQDRVLEAEQVSFAAIGWVGVAITIYAAISLMVTIENCFNIIYRAAQGRPWTSRVPVYWFLLTLSPLLIVAGNQIDTRFQELLTGLEHAAVGGDRSHLAVERICDLAADGSGLHPVPERQGASSARDDRGGGGRRAVGDRQADDGAVSAECLVAEPAVWLAGPDPVVHVLGLSDVAGGALSVCRSVRRCSSCTAATWPNFHRLPLPRSWSIRAT